jgi:hypothetical protein
MSRIEASIELPNIGEVTFFADLSAFTVENDGIGSYEFWGQKCYDKGNDYLNLEELDWNKNLYTAEQNLTIDNWVNENAGEANCPFQKLCDIAEPYYYSE